MTSAVERADVVDRHARATAVQRFRAAGFVLLVADPEPVAAGELATVLAAHQVTAIVCTDGAEALIAAGSDRPDAVLAAAAVPTVGGAALARAVSARTAIPVVVGIGDGDGAAAAEALQAGAAACVAYPFRARELLPVLRGMRPGAVLEAQSSLECGPLRLDPSAMEVRVRGRLIRMPMRELRLLHLLMTHAGRVVSREQIRDSVWGGAPGSNTITVHVQRLRHRLGDDQAAPELILTVRGVGYRLVPPDTD